MHTHPTEHPEHGLLFSAEEKCAAEPPEDTEEADLHARDEVKEARRQRLPPV